MLRKFSKPCRLIGKQFQKRFLDLYEYHAKELFTQYGISHQRGFSAHTPEEAVECALRIQEEFDVDNIIVKAQVLAGGRGKGEFDTGFKGGVKFCTDMESVEDAAVNMLGNRIHTVQTPPDGLLVKSLFVAECLDFDRELYFACLLDRDSGGPVIIASTEGGVEIEEIAKTMPEKIATCTVNIQTGPTVEQLDDLAEALDLSEEGEVAEFHDLTKRIYTMLMERDLLQVEINPLVDGKDGLICLDAKVGFDDNAFFRQPEIDEKKDLSELDETEILAKEHGLEYVALDGNIGCLVNGAGLAMATMDIIKHYGGEPANFLDVGGGATVEQIENAFKIITSEEKVQCILVNIFGGIMKCDIIAEGIIKASENLDLDIPLVVRLEGTNVEIGKKLLEESGLEIQSAADLDEAAQIACSALQ